MSNSLSLSHFWENCIFKKSDGLLKVFYLESNILFFLFRTDFIKDRQK